MENQLDRLLAAYCSPALAGIKPANLVSCDRVLYPDLPETLETYREAFAPRGMRFEIVCSCHARYLLLVYNEAQLSRYMQLGGGAVKKDVLSIGGIELDDRSKEVSLDGEKISLTRTEYDILKLLMEHPGEVFSPNQIYEQVWQDNPYGTENTVAVHIRHLREKVEYNPAEPRYLKVVWGRGYKMEGQV